MTSDSQKTRLQLFLLLLTSSPDPRPSIASSASQASNVCHIIHPWIIHHQLPAKPADSIPFPWGRPTFAPARPPSRPCPATVVQPTHPRRPGPLRRSAVCMYLRHGARGMDTVRSPRPLEETLGAAQASHPLQSISACDSLASPHARRGCSMARVLSSGFGYRPVQQPPTASHPDDRLPRAGELHLLLYYIRTLK